MRDRRIEVKADPIGAESARGIGEPLRPRYIPPHTLTPERLREYAAAVAAEAIELRRQVAAAEHRAAVYREALIEALGCLPDGLS